MRSVIVSGSVDMASSPDDVWPLLTDTDRGNRLIGSGPVTFRPIEAGANTPARFLAETTAGGFKLAYEELPFEWSHGRSFGVFRRMRGGPLASYSMSWSLKRMGANDGLEGGTRATVRIELTPRWFFLWPLAWLNARRFVRSLVDLAEAIDAHVGAKAPSPYLKPISPVDLDQLAFATEQLKKSGTIEGRLVDRLADFVVQAPDADVLRIRPFELAERWGEDRREVLRLFLRAVPSGLLELRWGILCPSCQTASQQVRALDEIAAEGHCQLCDISFELDLDKAVEATFLPHPSVRVVPEQLFCIGGPARTPHVMVQSNFDPGQEKKLDVPAAPGRYRVFVRGGSSSTLEVTTDGPETGDAVADERGVHPPDLVIRAGGTLSLTNQTDEARHAKIERLGYATLAATAHMVSTIGDFRALFSSDLLKRGTPLKVSRVSILFSDLTGSTALYSKVGDAAAFRLVDDHFDLLREIITRHEGTVVKTMGDAVMAAFADGRHCARAAIDALRRFEDFCGRAKHGDLVGIKLGMFGGACYVVTANGALDYFGQTVNVASRVQHLADSGELLLPEEDLASLDPAERACLVVKESLTAKVKGVEAPIPLVRVGLLRA